MRSLSSHCDARALVTLSNELRGALHPSKTAKSTWDYFIICCMNKTTAREGIFYLIACRRKDLSGALSALLLVKCTKFKRKMIFRLFKRIFASASNFLFKLKLNWRDACNFCTINQPKSLINHRSCLRVVNQIPLSGLCRQKLKFHSLLATWA